MTYRIAGNIGGDLNLAVWAVGEATAKFKSVKFRVCAYYMYARWAYRQI